MKQMKRFLVRLVAVVDSESAMDALMSVADISRRDEDGELLFQGWVGDRARSAEVVELDDAGRPVDEGETASMNSGRRE